MSKTLWLALLAAILIAGFLFFRLSENPPVLSPSLPTPLPTPSAPVTTAPPSSPNIDANLGHKQDKLEEFNGWHEFIPPNGKFKASFPSLPQHATQKLEDPKSKESRQYEMYVSEMENGTIFMISLITMLDPQKGKIDEEVLKTVINDIVSTNPNSKVKQMKMGTYLDNPAMDFSVENGVVTIDGKAFIIGNTLYLLTSAAKIDSYKPNEFNYFLKSFKLTKPSTEQLPEK